MPDEHRFVVDTSASPHAALRPVGPQQVRVTDTFWEPRLRRNREVTIPAEHQQCETTGALQNFQRAARSVGGSFSGRYYSDSDVYKWLEAASWTLLTDATPQLRAQVDEVIKLVSAAQDSDGYLNTYFSVERVGERWTDLDVRHEMYCIGHLVAAAVAHTRATGETSLLDVAERASGLIAQRYAPGTVPGTCGHPGLEMSLVELYRTTGDGRWLDLATWQLDSRGVGVLDGSEYLLDHEPVRQQTRVTGHAVRALYLYAGMADVILETGDTELRGALEALWEDLSSSKTSVNGGVGARWDGESFGDAYELSDRPYNETCAAIAHIFLAWRLLMLTGDLQYRDVIERTLYNAVLPGLSLSGTEFFYQNPLADSGRHRREPWFSCACCPPNVARLLASLPGYLYARTDTSVTVMLYIGNDSSITLTDGTELRLRLETDLPWTGDVRLTVQTPTPAEFDIILPIPAWADGRAVATVNGTDVEIRPSEQHLVVRRHWAAGDTVELSFPMDVQVVSTHPRSAMTHDRVALQRGPLVYCLEQADNPALSVTDVRLTGNEDWTARFIPELLGGVATLTAETATTIQDNGPLYRRYTPEKLAPQKTAVTAIPYFAWANREAGDMRVFIPLASSASTAS
jgi:DUF1680 family protein